MSDRLDTLALVRSALGREPFDLVIRDIQIVNVYTGEIEPGAMGIKEGHIVALDARDGTATGATFDGRGLYAIPGLIDTHMHIEPTMLTPEHLAELTVPHGTTALFADPMEIANVAGKPGIESLLQAGPRLPYHLLVEVSSRVPTAPGLETTGGELELEQVERMLESQECISLGELDPSKVLGLRPEYYAKIAAARRLGKIANGHAIGLSGADLVAYAVAGLADDHECVTYADAKARVRLGMAVLIREGSTERNLDELVRGLVREHADTRHWMMCTDDKHPNDILREGHIDYMVNRAIALGLPPVQAIQMATLNAAAHFRLDHLLGSLAPGRCADIVLTPRLDVIEPAYVFYQGELVAQQGKLLSPIPSITYPARLCQTVTLRRGTEPEDYALPADGSSRRVRVIRILPDQIVNKEEQATLAVVDGRVVVDTNQDVLKLAVVERYGKNGNIGIGLVRGFGIKRGALSCTIAHDHHNLIIVGVDDTSMATCAKAALAMQGGLVVAEGTSILAQLPLPIGGLMSDRPAAATIAALEQLNAAARTLGCVLPAPFMTLSFVSLPTVPELGITDMGLVNVREHKLTNVLL